MKIRRGLGILGGLLLATSCSVEKENLSPTTSIFDEIQSYTPKNIKQEIEEIKEKYKDSDFDRLTDREEKFIYGTNPYSKDTDFDGKTDYEEIKINYTNPKIKSKNIEIER